MTTTIVQLAGDTPMTFLEQCQRVRQEVGANGTGPSTVISQSGEYKRIVDWVASADTDVQRRHNEWKFMRGNFEIQTIADDPSYISSDTVIPITNFRDWRKTTFRIRLTSAGIGSEVELCWIDYQTYLDQSIGNISSGFPSVFAIGNSMEILLWPKPNDIYTITGEYQKSTAKMTADDDAPPYPAEFHMLPVYRAMMRYARYNSASEIYQDALIDYNRMMQEMERTQLPEVGIGGPLDEY